MHRESVATGSFPTLPASFFLLISSTKTDHRQKRIIVEESQEELWWYSIRNKTSLVGTNLGFQVRRSNCINSGMYIQSDDLMRYKLSFVFSAGSTFRPRVVTLPIYGHPTPHQNKAKWVCVRVTPSCHWRGLWWTGLNGNVSSPQNRSPSWSPLNYTLVSASGYRPSRLAWEAHLCLEAW